MFDNDGGDDDADTDADDGDYCDATYAPWA